MLASSLLVFRFDFTSFGVILLLGGSQFATLEVEIYLRVLRLPNLPLAAQQLVQQACDNGGRDNVSVILVRVVKDFAARTGMLDKMKSWFR